MTTNDKKHHAVQASDAVQHGEIHITDDEYKASLEMVEARLGALTPGELIAINVDISSAVKTVLGSMPNVRALTVSAGVKLPGFDAASFDDVELLARAAGWAHARFRGADQTVEPIDAMATALVDTRERLVADYTALSKRGVVDGHLLGQLKGASGYQNVHDDVLALVGQLDSREDAVVANSGIKRGELARIRQQAFMFIEALGRREQAAHVSPEVVSTRARSYTLFWRAYDEVRRTVAYLRWHEGDAESIAPSLYGGRQRAKKDAGAEAAGDAPATDSPVPPASAAPVTTPAAPMRGGSAFGQ